MAVQLIMAQPNKTNNAALNSVNISIDINRKSTISPQQQQPQPQPQQQQEKRAMFHDFLGMKPSADSPAVLASKNADASPSASLSVGASTGGGRGPLSAVSDLASERQAGNHLEGIPFYGPRSDISGHEISNRLVGSKRSNSDSAFIGPTRDGILQMAHGSVENLRLMKMLKNGGGLGERQRRSIDDESLHGMRGMRPTSATLIPQSSGGSRLDANLSKWERSVPIGATMQYPTSAGQFVPFSHQIPANRFRDTNAGPSVISQSAADEGSRTGIKGPGILSSISTGAGNSEKRLSGPLSLGSKPRSAIQIPEPEASTPSSRQSLASPSRQMTIFYGGQAYVFDEVHPNKADVIMALAGSNGGSWSTTYSTKPSTGPGSESNMTSGEGEAAGLMPNAAFQRDFRGRLVATGTTTQAVGTGDRIAVPTGSITEKRNSLQKGQPGNEEKKET
ncbi:hypothetical protein Tsubulata_012061 [Turnera subulata]|uniref:Protein TIFY n=1 Tax=Turnera subulata TaxID=218843 RepID=A0A9Q0J4P5_9ROSI|nr:hypothetical protein Tsubulata_012061 [Turnera subulata]